MTITAITLRNDHARGQGPDMWVQEAIFGHRYVEEQKAFMLVLEVLAIARVMQVDDRGKPHEDLRVFQHHRDGDGHENFGIPLVRARALRYMLFKDSSLEQIQKNKDIPSDQRLKAWVSKLNEGYKASVKSDPISFDYLIDRFGDRFDDIAQAIRILRGLELDSINKRRWTSRFLAPRGPNLHFSDTDEGFKSDRRFFGRGGEMIYLMLSRSARAEDLGRVLSKQFFTHPDPLDRIAQKLVPPGPADIAGDAPIGYLPLSTHPSYDRMAEDWHAILTLEELPIPQKVEPLFRVTALNLIRYFSERSHEVTGRENIDPMPLDVTFGAKADLRSLSKSYLGRLRQMIDEATETYIRKTLEDKPSWRQALTHADPNARQKLARNTIKESFSFKKADDLAPGGDAERMLDEFVAIAKSRSRNNISTLIEPLGKAAGFIDARQRIGSWFSASDEMLEALVLARVRTPKTITDFLADLYGRYRIVIGPREARLEFKTAPCDISSFEENLRMFEKRLTGLGYVKRLSDDCAFVSNPYCMAKS